jgi:hypothetical protein
MGLVGWEGALGYPAFAMRADTAQNLGAVPAALMPNLRGIVEGWSFGSARGVMQIFLITSSLALLVFVVWKTQPVGTEQFGLQFSLVTVVALLLGWHTNAHDLCLLILPLVLIADYCLHALAAERGRKLLLLLPALPILIGPFWIALWLRYGKVNLMAIPLLWWGWEIGREISRASGLTTHGSPRAKPSSLDSV